MKTETEKEKAAHLLAWEVAKVPDGTSVLKAGGACCGLGAVVRLSQEQADTLNAALPGCVVFRGI